MSTDPVDAEDVERVASLARVELAADEIEAFTADFREILEYFDTLDDVPDVDSEPELVNVMRTDAVTDSLSQDDALRNAGERESGRFKGPRVS